MSELRYWERPEWPEQLKTNIDEVAGAIAADWAPFIRGIAQRCECTLEQATLLYICQRLVWWTDANVKQIENMAPVVEHMKKEVEDDEKGESWQK